MNRALRKCVLAAGAAALFSAQVAYAAPVRQAAPAVDPLVSLSALGTSQSRAAVCNAGQCAAPVAATAATTAAMQDYGEPKAPKSMTWPLIIGLIVVIGLAVLLLSGDNDGDGDLTPVSP